MSNELFAAMANLLAQAAELVDQQPEGDAPDAASWSAERPEGSDMDGGRFSALVIRHDGELGHVALTAETATERIAKILGERQITPMDLVQGVGFWRGGFAAPRTEINPPATLAITRLVKDVIAGNYAVSDRDLARVQRLRRNNMSDLTIHGACVITGLSIDLRPVPMPERLREWVDELLTDVAYYQLGSQIAEQIRATGVPPHRVTNVMVNLTTGA
ncbi:hypothetical protein V5P93_000441 [Actinokineospora auranticolor]|uniref:Uncharacterized protein n=1 Tax=Actinokineospora auranticolor TaxID=155976 RepID=A0A2S6GE49_9PSEU|nr:hypothetical protein [Actinokineospora auranticolor]PPK63505.1 hypothetical protein CLV40_12732 [Actinokineospora auranticolor]